MTPLWMRVAFLVFGLTWLTLGTLALTEGDTGEGVVKLALGIGWLLVVFFRDRFAPRYDAALERQRSRVEGFGAMPFLPDRDDADTP